MLKNSYNLKELPEIFSSAVIPSEAHFFKMFLYNLWLEKKKILLSNDILLSFKQFCLDQNRKEVMEETSSGANKTSLTCPSFSAVVQKES
ncbi:MAG: hypothetical protein JXB88_19600 [Spirochaetales bacterium]|nr:hypothetical protein [Spirochaetales bacterium]